MNNLRDALGKEDGLEIRNQMPSASMRTHRKDNSQSIWSIGMGSDDEESQDISIREVERMQKLIDRITACKGQGMLPNEVTSLFTQ